MLGPGPSQAEHLSKADLFPFDTATQKMTSIFWQEGRQPQFICKWNATSNSYLVCGVA